MIGLGTIVNCAAVLAGTALGVLLGGGLPRRFETTIMQALGLCTFFHRYWRRGRRPADHRKRHALHAAHHAACAQPGHWRADRRSARYRNAPQ